MIYIVEVTLAVLFCTIFSIVTRTIFEEPFLYLINLIGGMLIGWYSINILKFFNGGGR